MDKKPFISIITPTYNRAKLLEVAILSVASQKTEIPFDWEMIIVDDGSSDNTRDIVNKYMGIYPKNIKYFWQEDKWNRVGRARNIALSNLNKGSDYLIFLDSDDELIEDCFFTCLKKCEELKLRWEYDSIVRIYYFCKTQVGKLVGTKRILSWKQEIYLTYHDFLQNKIKFEFGVFCKSKYFLENSWFRFSETVINELVLVSKMYQYFNKHWLKCLIIDYVGRIYRIWYWIQITKTISLERFKNNAIWNEKVLEIIWSDLLKFWYGKSYWEYLFRIWINRILYWNKQKWLLFMKRSLKYQFNLRNIFMYFLSSFSRQIVLLIYKIYI